MVHIENNHILMQMDLDYCEYQVSINFCSYMALRLGKSDRYFEGMLTTFKAKEGYYINAELVRNPFRKEFNHELECGTESPKINMV